MNHYHNNHNGARDMKPLMAMPNGQIIYWEEPQSHHADYSFAPSASRRAQPIVLVLLGVAVSVALLVTRFATF